LDALALDLLPPAAPRKVIEEVRYADMIELLANGATRWWLFSHPEP
jgi:hypothetical protein